MSVLEINNIRKNFGDKEVLKGIDLKVEEGEVVSILGPSGSGKSTLLRCATFLEKADGGTISYCDEEVVKTVNGTVTYPGKKKLKWAREQFGLVFQNFNLFPHFTVRKNVSDAPIVNQKRDPDEVRKTVEGLLEKVGLSEEA
ncbi:MAG: amino acid ABC transporter ATP-binding protein, partial [Eubacterium sp.]|nr:amino acid ABC transporter ATP-binding protein [Eubacterium sp.]